MLTQHQGCSNLSLQEVKNMASLMVTMENVTAKSGNGNSISNNKTKTREIEGEVTDEFAPDVPNNDDSSVAPETEITPSNDTNTIQ